MKTSTLAKVKGSVSALGSATRHIGAATYDMGKVLLPVAGAMLGRVPKAAAATLDTARTSASSAQRKNAAFTMGLGVAAVVGLGIATYAHFAHRRKKARADREQGKAGASPRAELKLLGNKDVDYSSDFDPTLLETFENKHQDRDYMVTFRCPEFTTLCPITGQPDFATLYINYIPSVRMVESKSLKLYLFSFRNHGDFHEDVVNIILDDLVKLMDPKYIEVRGMFYPRGGISIYPFANWAKPGSGYEDYASTRSFEQLADLDSGDGAR